MKADTRSPSILPLWPIAFFLFIFVDKIYFMMTSLKGFSGHLHNRILFSVIFEDAAILCFLCVVSLFFRSRMRFLAVLLVLCLNVFYAMDSLTIQALYARLTLPTLYTYSKELQSVLAFLSPTKTAAICLVIGILWIIRKKKLLLPLRTIYVAGIGLLCGIAPWVINLNPSSSPVIDIASLNIIRINQKVVVRRIVPESALLQIQKEFPHIDRGVSALAEGVAMNSCQDRQKRNIILLVSESLSQVDSMRSGSIYNRLPMIDEMQSHGLTLTNVVSDGTNTSDALAALLLGVNPMPTELFSNDMPVRFPVSGFPGRNLIAHAKKQGYKTLALTNFAMLEFQQNREWLLSLGFDSLQDGNSVLFMNLPRYSFNSPSDEALFSNAVKIIGQQREPFLLIMLTSGMHKPHRLPDRKFAVTRDPFLNQLHYVDQTTYDFYRNLQRNGFFRNGMLVLTGDHRRMDPLDSKEIEARGTDAYGRVLAAVIGEGVDKGRIDNVPLNQTDLNTMILSLLHGCDIMRGGLSYYNKNRILAIKKPFTTHIISDSLGWILVRAEGERPRIITFDRSVRPAAFSNNPVIAEIVGYLALTASSFHEKQKEALQ